MAPRDAFPLLCHSSRSKFFGAVCTSCRQSLRHASSATTQPRPAATAANDDDLDRSSFMSPDTVSKQPPSAFDPVAKAHRRKRQLVPSRYQFRPPKYDRGPLHPHQSPPVSDPSSREFIPGPFSSPRLKQTYHSTIAPDLMTMAYIHNPPGFRPPEKGPRLRNWDDSSPYHKNRPLRGPRGGDVLRLLRKPITFQNIPALTKVTVHSYVKDAATSGSAYLHVAGMVVQAITNVRAISHKARHSEAKWGLVKGKTSVAVTAEITGEDVYHFLSKLIDVVLPRIKDWNGVRATTGDSSGNLTFGLDPDVVAGFPEIEVNYDSYPPRMIPGCHITIHTTADTDRDARLLLTSIGIPFYGKISD